jgi:hypothetical protein
MWKNKWISFLISFILAILVGYLPVSNSLARFSLNSDQINPPPETDLFTPTLGTFPTNTVTPTQEPTKVFNLPIVQQEAPFPMSTLQISGEQLPPPTQTPTPIPIQTYEDNAPIVFGAMAIVLIIILAWFFVGRKTFDSGL